MSSPQFTFVPRRIAGQKPTLKQRRVSTPALPNPSTSAPPYGIENSFDKGVTNLEEQQGPSKPRKEGKSLDDSDYADLLALALSDYALWSNQELLESMNANDEGYISLRQLLNISPVLSGLTPMPSESLLVRCVKDNELLERRMIVSGQSWTDGGYEIRRRDWPAVKERLRRYTAFQWDNRTIYVENLPSTARVVPSMLRFIEGLFKDRSETDEQAVVESMTFLRHRDDILEDTPSYKSKGFAFVVLSRTSDADYLLRRWPWRIHDRAQSDDRQDTCSEAVASGFRCMSKNTWEKLKDEYLARQKVLLKETVAGSDANYEQFCHSRANIRTLADEPIHQDDLSSKKGAFYSDASASRAQLRRHIPSVLYPKDCLVFVRNVHPETNKTTLKNLFSLAINGKADAINYVDYNKGLDSCYLRLNSSSHTQALVDYFNPHRIVQINGLDNKGSESPQASTGVIEVELVQGKKEEVYWERIPEKIRRQALGIVYSQSHNDTTSDNLSSNDTILVGRNLKRKKRI